MLNLTLRKTWAPLTVLVCLAAGAQAQLLTNPEFSARSSFVNTSNLVGSYATYDGFLSHSALDPDTYLNDLEMTTGAGWDPDLDMNIASGSFDYNDGANYGTYLFGTPISGDQNWFIRNIAFRGDAVVDVDPGVYDFSLSFLGGADEFANDVLGRWDLSIEVAPFLDVQLTGLASPTVIVAGQQTMVSMTVRNSMSRDFISSTWFIGGAGGGLLNGNVPLDVLSFEGNWFDKTIVAGDSRTDNHSRWGASGSTPLGAYSGGVGGVVGGLYEREQHYVRMGNQMTVNVVPEPATLATLALGALLLRRRRSK